MWQDLFFSWLSFALKLGTVALLLLAFLFFLFYLIAVLKGAPKRGQIRIQNWKKNLESWQGFFLLEHGSAKQQKDFLQQEKKKLKQSKKTGSALPCLFVLDFKGDLRASQTELLKKEVSFLLQVAGPKDAVLVRVESGGGTVIGYGQAAAELLRLKKQGIKLYSAVDQIAASGGYMLAAVADQVLSAPFAVLGSIGVVVELPNFHKFLQKREIEYKVYTAGKHKRTVGLFSEIKKDGEEKLKQELATTHQYFKQLVKEHRKEVDIETLATGEFWYGQQALELKLVDAIMTSEEFLWSKQSDFQILEVRYVPPKNWTEKISKTAAALKKAFLADHSLLASRLPKVENDKSDTWLTP